MRGIGSKVISDNGKHFSAAAFRHFASTWGFELVLSSPEYPKGHALIERHIQTVKKCMKKCDVSGFDFDLALLVLRSTPLSADIPSPAELLQGRRFRTTLPTYVPSSQISEEIQKKLKLKQETAAQHYDKTAKTKQDLTQGQHVRLLNKETKRWEPAVVCGQASTPRSYVVQRLDGGVPLRRNRVHLRETSETFENMSKEMAVNDDEELVIPSQSEDITSQVMNSRVNGTPDPGSETTMQDEPTLRRSVRVRKETQFYKPS